MNDPYTTAESWATFTFWGLICAMAITDFFAWSKSLKNDGDIYFMHDDEDAALLWSPIPDGQIYVKLTPTVFDMIWQLVTKALDLDGCHSVKKSHLLEKLFVRDKKNLASYAKKIEGSRMAFIYTTYGKSQL